METFEVRSKAYSVKWVNLPPNCQLKWSIKPVKNSINLAIYRNLDHQTGTPPATTPATPRLSSALDNLSINAVNQLPSRVFNISPPITRCDSVSSHSSSSGELKFENLERVYSIGRCQGDEVKDGSFVSDAGGLYAFIFDNTFSKTKSKKIKFSYEQIKLDAKVKFDLPKNTPETNTTSVNVNGIQFIQGYLLKKKRRKGGKTFNKRFFTLNLNYAILDYYINENSKSIRGNMLITQSVISADSLELMIYLDSGMEQWILKAQNKEDFNLWIAAFNLIKRKNVVQQQSDILSISESVRLPRRWTPNPKLNIMGEKLRALKLLIDDSIDTARAQQIQHKPSVSSIQETPIARRASFFSKIKRKSSPAAEDWESISSTPPPSPTFQSSHSSPVRPMDLLSQLNDIKSKMEELEELYHSVRFDEESRSESRKTLTRRSSISGNTSINSSEFFDAQEFIEEVETGVVMLNEEEMEDTDIQFKAMDTSSDEYDDEDETVVTPATTPSEVLATLDLCPLPFSKPYTYRKDVSIACCEPPSIMSILRKGIGKDLTNMSMPISCNEPLSFLQKYSESFEFTNLLTDSLSLSPEERFINVGVFAISYLSSYRDKIRCLRKPFNPLLGETFELVRPEFGLRVLCEKVVHKPFKMACHAQTPEFQLTHTLEPVQNFYGKSADLVMNGKIKLSLANGEIYEWSQPTTALRNMITLTGEKYTEPSEDLEVRCITNGGKLKVKFIPESSRFSSSRSERVEIFVNGKKVSFGKWTESIKLTSGKEIWKVGSLVQGHEKKWGFTEFSASLNHLDEVHSDCGPTDSRRRPDQKLYEEGSLEQAETLKIKLEEDQRNRRKAGAEKPHFFKENQDGTWCYIEGPVGYWARRAANDWDGIVKLW